MIITTGLKYDKTETRFNSLFDEFPFKNNFEFRIINTTLILAIPKSLEISKTNRTIEVFESNKLNFTVYLNSNEFDIEDKVNRKLESGIAALICFGIPLIMLCIIGCHYLRTS